MCERSVPQAATPPPQMTIDDTNSRRNHKTLSDYKHNESLTYYCWLNGAMGKDDCGVSQEFSHCFISRACLHFTGSLWAFRAVLFSSLFIPQVLFPSHDNFEVSTRVLMLLHSFSWHCVCCHPEKHNYAPPRHHPPPSCVFDKNLPGLFSPLSAALTISSSAFSSLHVVMYALNKSRPAWTLTRAFACANTRADVMRVRTPSNMVPIMCLSFSKLKQYSTMTDECCTPQGRLRAVRTGK